MTAVHRTVLLVLLASVVKVSTDCSGASTVLTNETGQLTSPGWPTTNYGNGLSCTWYINLAQNKYPSIVITDLVMQQSTNDVCQADYLQFTSGGNMLLKVCGIPSSFPITVLSTTNVILVKFVTDQYINEKGFKLQWFSSTQPGVFVTTVSYNSTTVASEDVTSYYYALFGLTGVFLMFFILFLMKKHSQGQQANAVAVRPAARSNAPATAPAYTAQDPPPPYQAVDTNAPPPPPPEKKHIMISYQWGVKQQVARFRKRLKREGYRVWIDTEQLHKSKTTMEGMAVGVKNAVVVVPVLTSQYAKSDNCKKEITFAAKNKKSLLPVRMEKKFVPGTDWLGLLLGNTIWYDLSDSETYEMHLTNFFGALANLGQAARNDDGEEESYDVFSQRPQPTEGQVDEAETASIN